MGDYWEMSNQIIGRKAPANQFKWINFCFSHWEKHNKLFYSTYLIADLKFIVCSCLTLTIFTKISLLERTSLWTIFEIKTKALLSSQHFVIYSTQESNIILVCCSYCLWYFSQQKTTTAAYLHSKFHKSNNIMTQLQCTACALRKKWASFTLDWTFI